MELPKSSSNSKLWAFIGALVMAVLVFLTPLIIENLDSKDIMVIQSVGGELTTFTDPGPKMQNFGKVTTYPRRKQYSFCSQPDASGNEVICPGADAEGKKVRFSEGGHAVLNGAVSWEMPMDAASIIEAHKAFGSEEAIESAAVSKMIDSAIYFSGPMMSSTESSGARRGELVQYINDQAMHGIYVTRSKQEESKDAAGGIQTVTITEIVRDTKTGQPMRQQGSILAEFKIALLPIAINELRYDRVVEKQIADRQASTTEVQLAIATAVKAEQQAKTVEAEGKATAAKAKWDQEAIKAQKVTEAQQAYEVAVLAAKEAEQYKKQQILRGEGDGARARLVMQANGALEQKLAAYVEVNKNYADAISKYTGNWVPTTYMGGAGGHSNGAADLIQMLSAKTARELSLDTTMKK